MGGGNGLKNGVLVHQHIPKNVTIVGGDVVNAKLHWKV